MCTLFGMALGGWMSGKIFDLTGSYQAAFVNGIAWNLVNLTIVILLLRMTRRRVDDRARGSSICAAGIQDRVGSTDRVLNLRILAEPPGPAARRLLAGQLDQRVDAGPGDSGDHGAVVGPDPGLGRQAVRNPRPALPLIVERDAGVDHRSPLRQEDIVDRPVEAAGRT